MILYLRAYGNEMNERKKSNFFFLRAHNLTD
jgi:hypothetical protein